jgi:HPr kinase/phosphorylase
LQASESGIGAPSKLSRSHQSSIQKEKLTQLCSRNFLPGHRAIPDSSVLLDRLAIRDAVFRTHMITISSSTATIALEFDFAPSTGEYGNMVDIRELALIRGERHRQADACSPDRAWV